MSKHDEVGSYTRTRYNPHFVQFTFMLYVPFHSPAWRGRNRETSKEFDELVGKIEELMTVEAFAQPDTWKELVTCLLTLFSTLTMTDTRLGYWQEDLEWLLHVLDSPQGLATLWMLFAVAQSEHEYYTPAQLAELTRGTEHAASESVWRARAETIPGAFKPGKQWVYPAMGLRAIGVKVPWQPGATAGDIDAQGADEHVSLLTPPAGN